MKKAQSLLVLAALSTLAVAQTSNSRIIEIEGNISGDLRNGPINFTGTASDPVKATVSTLKINALRAVFSAPTGTPITNARGKRTAEFSDAVTVTRGRLTAKGSSLTYSEVEGSGTLRGNASAVFRPQQADQDPVNITANAMSFDVDTNMSTSRGDVKLVSGSQTGTGDQLVFDENREVGVITGGVAMNRAAKGNQKALTISGEEARVQTDDKLVYMKGKVRVVSGSITTTGNEMYYDDAKNIAVIVGNAVSVEKTASGNRTVRGPAIEQRTDLGRVRQLTSYKIDTSKFKLSNEK
ncbi:LptA/OstA family protein [Deinococcus yavapaiensis]|uniref:Lipopolysaccharide export system protein LptA n=1 Tax=Deinococcus yavapaiensis KR-236 TaxID=694435 RepID=A0A318SAN7_9DEIO|nr:LptA/OstA family protein [Deinococcus yavapaiensis]PYE55929.1 lipopolysaccharide export system protein LptA [Deinococcus yavapaiensis KR-236]